jgi:hypothetical protein
MALRHPQRLRSLVMLNSSAKIPEAKVSGAYTLGEDSTPAAINKFGVSRWIADTMAGRVDTTVAPPELVRWMTEQMGETPAHVASGLFACFASLNLHDQLQNVMTSTLLLSGADSPVAAHHQDPGSDDAKCSSAPDSGLWTRRQLRLSRSLCRGDPAILGRSLPQCPRLTTPTIRRAHQINKIGNTAELLFLARAQDGASTRASRVAGLLTATEGATNCASEPSNTPFEKTRHLARKVSHFSGSLVRWRWSVRPETHGKPAGLRTS